MAGLGRDFYGLSKYGANVLAEFDVNPFTADPEGYNAIRVRWHVPTGTWTRLRLLKNRYGYAANENDGAILIDSTSPVSQFHDSGLSGGTFYYYTLFVQSGGSWYRSGATSGLALADSGIAAMLWERIPRYFRYVRRYGAAVTDEYFVNAQVVDPSRYDQENQHLQQFLAVIAWGLEYLREYQQTLLRANDPHTMHLENLDRLAHELGISFEYVIPANVMRARVANAALLARKRGTLDGLRDVVGLSTGWDVTVQMNQNLFLSPDQSEFANPTFPEWDSGINYGTGQQVEYLGRIYTANLGGAYGSIQQPPADPGVSNTWWTLTFDADITTVGTESKPLRNPSTNAVVTWKTFQDGATYAPAYLAAGISSPFDISAGNSNALRVKNGTGADHPYEVWGAANPSAVTSPVPQPGQVVRQGIPIPRVLAWDATTDYLPGEYASDRGRAFRALDGSRNMPPNSSPLFWEQVGIDTRPKMAYSFYGHGPVSGTAGSGGVAVTPGLAFFDQRGTLLKDAVSVAYSRGQFYDTFNNMTDSAWTGRNADLTFAGEQWQAPNGTWGVWDVAGATRVAFPRTSTATTVVPVPASTTSYRVAVTFNRAATASRTDALALRYVDAANYVRVTRTAVQKRVGGVLTTLATLSTPITDGDRVIVQLDDAANTYTVYRNGTVVASGSGLPTSATPYKHGLMVE